MASNGLSQATTKLVGVGDLPGGPVVKNPSANAEDMDSVCGGEDPTCCSATKPMCHNY